MKSLSILFIFCSLLSSYLFAQEKTVIKSVEVTASELTARAGAAKEFRSLGKFKREEILPVYSIAGDWYETKCPPELKVYVFQKYITVTGNDGVIIGESVNGRADASEDATVLFKFPIKTRVNVLGLTNGWVLIAPPPQATAWVAKQYTKDAQGAGNIVVVENTSDSTKIVVNEDNQATSETKKPTTTKTNVTVKGATKTNTVSPEVQNILDERERKKGEIVKNQEKTQREILEATEEAGFLKTGWVRRLGRVIGRKATHALYISEGADLCHLISNDDSIKLEDYSGKYVGIYGEENGKEKRSDVPLITVTKIVVLEGKKKGVKLNDSPATVSEEKPTTNENNNTNEEK